MSQSILSNNMLENKDLVSKTQNVSMYDTTNGLELYCYTSCDNNSSHLQKSCRGLVYDKEGKLILCGFPYTDELNIEKDSDDITARIGENISDWSFFEAQEGTIIRMFYHDSTWYITTHRKLDAFKSKWSSKASFGEIFREALNYEKVIYEYPINIDELTSVLEATTLLGNLTGNLDILTSFLNKDSQYFFLVRNTKENRIVCTPPGNSDPHVYHIGTRTNGIMNLDDDIGISKPKKITFTDTSDLARFVTESDPYSIQGVICIKKDFSDYLRLSSTSFQNLYALRGNEMSVRFRYLQVRNDPDIRTQLESLYPEHKEEFQAYEDTLLEIAQIIYDAYVSRFIQKQFTVLPQEEYRVMSECHTRYCLDPCKNKVNLSIVFNVLNSQSAVSLNHMIKRFKTGAKYSEYEPLLE